MAATATAEKERKTRNTVPRTWTLEKWDKDGGWSKQESGFVEKDDARERAINLGAGRYRVVCEQDEFEVAVETKTVAKIV